MAFSWVEDISSGALITKAAIDEIRSNVDSVVDNLSSCFTHYATYDVDLHSGHDGALYTTYQNNLYTGLDNALYSYCNANYPGYHNGLDSTYKASHYTSFYADHL